MSVLRRALRHPALLVLVGGVALFVAAEAARRGTDDPTLDPVTLLIGAAVVPVAVLVLIHARRLPFTVGSRAVVGVALATATAGLLLAATVEHLLGLRVGEVGSMMQAGLVEETTKLLAPLVVFLAVRDRLRVVDGLLLGVASATGFAVAETMGYGYRAGLGLLPGGSIRTLIVRGALSPVGHLAWTGLAAVALAAVVVHRGRAGSLVRFVATFVGVVVLHGLWDASFTPTATVLTHVGVAIVGVGALTVVVRRATRAVGAAEAEERTDAPADPATQAPDAPRDIGATPGPEVSAHGAGSFAETRALAP